MTDAILRDVTEKRLLEAQKMESVGQLAGGIAHDFNNILTAIISFGSLLKPKLGEDATQVGYLNQIFSAADRASHLTKSLLAYSRKQLIDIKRV